MICALRRRAGLLAAGIVATCSASSVFGQGNTFNPYGNSGYADYREFTTPMYSNDPSLPGQARLQNGFVAGQNRANQFEAYSNSLEGSGSDQFNMNRGIANGVPYYKTSRLYDKDDRRAYRPNDTPADRLFKARANERNAAYLKALEEKDPRKRAAMMQRIDQDALERPLGDITNKTPAQLKAAKTAAAARAARTQPPTSTPAARRTAPAASGTATRAAAATPAPVAATPAATTTPAPEPAATVNPSSVPIPAPR